ncbi:uncharacterized protein N7473_010178 [Penicillium subrubescens]|uniref:uncharacterized protein n=1 Tax=Penicillium subrubescens TaxID=1316194 RepID=UPI002544E210|nr:uncharacterized protein N7473_010178 [Penicillium subrubescens]KAJ5883292.1 hypothetical protein N7473_010178 [Penicillium subrubescens]
MVLEDNPYCIWRDIGFMPFNGVSNPPFVDYILDQITTADHEGEAMEAFAYVDLLRGLQSSIPHVHDDEVCDMLSLFHRRYAEAFGTPYRRHSASHGHPGGGCSDSGRVLDIGARTSPNISNHFRLLIGTEMLELSLAHRLVVKVVEDCVVRGLSEGLSKDSQFALWKPEQASDGPASTDIESQADKSH